MNIQDKFRGTGVALITPFTADNKVDFKSLGKLLNHVIDGGVEFLVVCGTTGEPVTMDEGEKKAVLDFVFEHNTKNLPIVVGCGGNNTAEIAKNAEKVDIDKMNYDDAIELIGHESCELRQVKSKYQSLCKVMENYTFKCRSDINGNQQ